MLHSIINAMEAPFLTSQQYTVFLPVGLVLILAVLVFAFGFKSSVEPPSFKHISLASEDRKNTKKKKTKDKKPQTNGHATVVIDLQDSKPKTETTKTKQVKHETPKQKKVAELEKPLVAKTEAQKSPAKKEKKLVKDNEGKTKKKNPIVEKPADFDEGEWEIAPSRKDKKNKKKDEQDVLPTYTPEKLSKKKGNNTNRKEGELVTVIEPKPMETLRIEDIMAQMKHDAAQAVVSVIAESNFEPSVAPVVVPTPVATPPAPVTSEAAPLEEASDEQVVKKKKVKKPKTVSETEAAPPIPAKSAASAPPEVNKDVAESPQVFNELEDAWKEAPQKKSKKKVRKD